MRSLCHRSLFGPGHAALACFILVASFSLACASHVPLPEQRMCEPGQSSEAWIAAQIDQMGTEALVDTWKIGAPTVFCEEDGSELKGTLRYVLVQKADVEGDRILRSRKWIERGAFPAMDPDSIGWRVDHLTGSEPVTVQIMIHQ